MFSYNMSTFLITPTVITSPTLVYTALLYPQCVLNGDNQKSSLMNYDLHEYVCSNCSSIV